MAEPWLRGKKDSKKKKNEENKIEMNHGSAMTAAD
jgi:hypothetical protein